MAEKLVPPTKPVGKADGINQDKGVFTTPSYDDKNGNKNFATDGAKGSIFKK